MTLDTGETVVVPKKDFGRVAVIGYGMSLGSLLSLARTSVLNALPEFVEGDVPRLRLDLGDTGDLPDKKETVPV